MSGLAVVIVESAADVASRTIGAQLGRVADVVATRERFDGAPIARFVEHDSLRLVTIAGRHVEAEGLDQRLRSAGIPCDTIVFLSRHASASAKPALTVHALGNFAEARVGGTPGLLTPAPAHIMTGILDRLASGVEEHDADFDVTFEATHHGPLLGSPACFAELGSDEEAWRDRRGARIVAKAVLGAATERSPDRPVVVGIGGGHYAPRFTARALQGGVSYGHIWPKHHINDREIESVVRKLTIATPDLSGAHMDRKGIPGDVRPRVLAALASAGIPEFDARSSGGPTAAGAAAAGQD